MCDLPATVGVPHALRTEQMKSKDLTSGCKPSCERQKKSVSSKRVHRTALGAFAIVVVTSDIRHPTDGPDLARAQRRHPLDADGIDAWQAVTRLYFATPRRHVAHGAARARISDAGTLVSESIDSPAVERSPRLSPRI